MQNSGISGETFVLIPCEPEEHLVVKKKEEKPHMSTPHFRDTYTDMIVNMLTFIFMNLLFLFWNNYDFNAVSILKSRHSQSWTKSTTTIILWPFWSSTWLRWASPKLLSSVFVCHWQTRNDLVAFASKSFLITSIPVFPIQSPSLCTLKSTLNKKCHVFGLFAVLLLLLVTHSQKEGGVRVD